MPSTPQSPTVISSPSSSTHRERALRVAHIVHELLTTSPSSTIRAAASPFFAVFCLHPPLPSEKGSRELGDHSTMHELSVFLGPVEAFTEERLKRRYRALALLLHPDRWHTPDRAGAAATTTVELVSQEALQFAPLVAVTSACCSDPPCTPTSSPDGSPPTLPLSFEEIMSRAFADMQHAHDVLLEESSRRAYVSLGHDTFCSQRLHHQHDHQQQNAAAAAAARIIAATIALFNTAPQAEGSTSAPQPCSPTPPPPSALTVRCASATPAPKCSVYVFIEGSMCSACRQASLLAASRKPLVSQSNRCKTFGCLRKVDAGDSADGEAAGSSAGLCSHCRSKPVKCSALGCFTMLTPNASSAMSELRCGKHLL